MRLSSVLGQDASLDGEAALLLRKLGKKAVETKTKALNEIQQAISSRGDEWSASLLPQWTLAFARLADDPSWQVREASCIVLGRLAQQLKKRIAPHLKQLITPWLRCRFDAQHDVRAAANGAFAAAFPGPGNYRRALTLFIDEVTRSLVELAHADPPGRTGDEATDAESGEAYARRVCTSLQAAGHLLTEAAGAASDPAAADPAAASALSAKVSALLGEQMLLPPLWRLASSRTTSIRCALYSFIQTLLERAPDLAATCAPSLAATLLDALKEQDPAGHAALWEPLLVLLQRHPDDVQASPAAKFILPRLLSLLKHGCHGAAPTVATALMPLVAQLPTDLTRPQSASTARPPTSLAPAAAILDAIYDGLRSPTLAAAHFRPMLKAHAEVLLLLVATTRAADAPDGSAAAAAAELLAVGLGGRLVALLNGGNPPRLSDQVATESLCASVVSLASSSKSSDQLDAYLCDLVRTCRDACTGSSAEAGERVATFLTTLLRQLQRAAKSPLAIAGPPDVARAASAEGRCAERARSLTRHVAALWCELVRSAATGDKYSAPAAEVIRCVATAVGVCRLWSAAYLEPNAEAQAASTTAAVPVCWLQPRATAGDGETSSVHLTLEFVPPTAADLAAMPDLMSRWLLPWMRTAIEGAPGAGKVDGGALVWTLLIAVVKEVGRYCRPATDASAADAASAAVATQSLARHFKEILAAAAPAHTARLLSSFAATSLPLHFWRCVQLDDRVSSAAHVALAAPEGGSADGKGQELSRGAALELTVQAAGSVELLSDTCLKELVTLVANTISTCIERHEALSSLPQLDAALKVAAALAQSLASSSSDLEMSDGLARGVSAMLIALYSTVVTWRPARAWLRSNTPESAPFSSAKGPSHDVLSEVADSADDDAALVAVAADPEVVEGVAEGAAEAEDAAEVSEAGDAEEGEDDASAACAAAEQVWGAMAPRAWVLLQEHPDARDEMAHTLRRLASNAVPHAVGYASGWRDGSRRWAWGVSQLTIALPVAEHSEIGGTVWRRELCTSGDTPAAPVVGAWRLCALSLALLRGADLGACFPASGERGELGVPAELLTWLLALYHAAARIPTSFSADDADGTSCTLHLELRAFVCARLLPYLRTTLPTRPPLLTALLDSALRIAIDAGTSAEAGARAAATVLRCALDASASLDRRRTAATEILVKVDPTVLPSALAAAHTLRPSVLSVLACVVTATSPITAYASNFDGDASDAAPFTPLARDALRQVMALRPTASAAARAALSRFGQAGDGGDEASELAAAARAVGMLCELLPLSARGLTPEECDTLLEQCMRLDDMRRSAAPPSAAAAAALRAALCRLLGAILVSSGSRAGVVESELVFKHGAWLLPLLEESLKAAAATSASPPAEASTSDALHGDEPSVRACVTVLLSMHAQTGSAATLSTEPDDTAAADSAAAAMAARIERLLQLVLTWLLAHAVSRASRLGSQRTLCMALQAATVLPPSVLPTGSAVAPIGALVCSPHPAVRARALALIGRLPPGNASLPRSTGGSSAEVDEDSALSEGVMQAVFSAPLLAAMHGGADNDVSPSVRFCAWAAALELHARHEPAARRALASHWKHDLMQEGSSVGALLHTLLDTLPLSAPAVASPNSAATSTSSPPSEATAIHALRHRSAAALCAAYVTALDDKSRGEPDVPSPRAPLETELAVCLYLQLVRQLPAIVREWWTHGLTQRGARKELERFTQTHFSPIVIREEVDAISEAIPADGETFQVKGSAATRQISATYSCEGSALQIMLQLPASYPLLAVEVECVHRIGIAEAKWRLWQRQISTMLLSQNGSISDALLRWKENVDKVFEGVEECPICYMIVHASTGHLPKQECKTCHNKFHAACLYKWFNQAQKSNCPLCQTAF